MFKWCFIVIVVAFHWSLSNCSGHNNKSNLNTNDLDELMNSNGGQINKEKAEELARNESYFFDSNPYFQPEFAKVNMNGVKCWKIESYEIFYTEEGDCAKTKGCTEIKIYSIWIDLNSGDILDKKYKRELKPNYE